METNRHGFNVESYKQIRNEVSVLLARIELLFRSSLLATTSVFAWLLTKAFGLTSASTPCLRLPVDALSIAWWIPTAFVALSGLIVFATHVRIGQMSGFLEACERELGDPALSWETYFRSKPPLFTVVTAGAWVLMLAAASYGGYVGSCLNELPYCRSA